MNDPGIDPRLLEVLQHASNLQSFQLNSAIERMLADPRCARRPNFDHPCRLNIDQGWKPVSVEAGCG